MKYLTAISIIPARFYYRMHFSLRLYSSYTRSLQCWRYFELLVSGDSVVLCSYDPMEKL